MFFLSLGKGRNLCPLGKGPRHISTQPSVMVREIYTPTGSACTFFMNELNGKLIVCLFRKYRGSRDMSGQAVERAGGNFAVPSNYDKNCLLKDNFRMVSFSRVIWLFFSLPGEGFFFLKKIIIKNTYKNAGKVFLSFIISRYLAT